MPRPSDLKPYFFFVCVLNGNNVNECEPLGELWEIKLQIAKLVSACWHGWAAMITRWVGTWAFIRDSHFSLISFPVIKSSEMDLSNCKVDGSIGLGEMSTTITSSAFSFLPLLHFFVASTAFSESFFFFFWIIRRVKLYSSCDICMTYSLQHTFFFLKKKKNCDIIPSTDDEPVAMFWIYNSLHC